MDLIKVFPLPKKFKEFPDGKIVLVDGNVLDCFPKTVPVQPASEEELQKNLYFLFEHMAAILDDSRMFLCPVVIGNEQATIGAIIENLKFCLFPTDAITKPEWIPYSYGRAPFGNLASFKCVNKNGISDVIRGNGDFVDVERLRRHRQHYNKACEMYETLSLAMVVSRLSRRADEETVRLNSTILFQQTQYNGLLKELNTLEKYREDYLQLSAKFNDVCHRQEIDEFVGEYLRREKEADSKIEALNAIKGTYKAQLKDGKLQAEDYRKLVEPIGKEISEIEKELSDFKFAKINEFCNCHPKDYGIITEAIKEAKQSRQHKY